MIPVYYRLKFGLPSSNDYTDRIKEQHPDLFEFVKESLEPLSKVVGLPIPDSEIAYFVVHFWRLSLRRMRRRLEKTTERLLFVRMVRVLH